MSDGLRTDNLVIPKGCSWGRAYVPVDGVNLTGATARAQVRPTRDSATVLHEWNTTNSTILIDPTAKSVTLTHGPSVSSAWTWTDGVFDLLVTTAAGDVLQLVQGAVKVDITVTR